MKLLKYAYEKVCGKPAPYYYSYSILKIIGKPIRKFVAQCIAPNCVFNNLRILLYRLCGFKIGKHVFIGMKCYLDDMCYDLLTIGNNVTISYGVYFACHGKNQGHYPIKIEDGAYIGMRASIISKNTGGGYYSGCSNWSKCHNWSLFLSEQRYTGWSHSRWRSLQDYSNASRKKEIVSCLESEVAA